MSPINAKFFLVSLCAALVFSSPVIAAGDDDNGKIIPFRPRKECKDRVSSSSPSDYIPVGTIYEITPSKMEMRRLDYLRHRSLMIKRIGPPLELHQFHPYGRYMVVPRSDKWGLFFTSPAELDYFLEAARLTRQGEEGSIEILRILLYSEMKVPTHIGQKIAEKLIDDSKSLVPLQPYFIVKEVLGRHNLRLMVLNENGLEI